MDLPANRERGARTAQRMRRVFAEGVFVNKAERAHPILVPVDFSPHSTAALLQAARLAECTGQRLLVLHVIHDPAEMPGYYGRVTKKKKLVRIEDLAREAFLLPDLTAR